MEDPPLFPEGPTPEQQAKKHSAQEEAYASLSHNVTSLGSRLRSLEEQYATVRNKSQLVDRNFIEFQKETNTEIKALTEEILELKRSFNKLKESIDIVTTELNNAVKEHEFRVLEKYVDLWNPGQFVTKEDLKKRIEEIKKIQELKNQSSSL